MTRDETKYCEECKYCERIYKTTVSGFRICCSKINDDFWNAVIYCKHKKIKKENKTC